MEYLRRRFTTRPSQDVNGFDTAMLNETDLYKKGIYIAWMSSKRLGISLDEKVKMIRKIGNLAWTGGTAASKFASGYLPSIVELLREPTMPTRLVITLINAVVSICWTHNDVIDKHRDMNVLQTLYDILESSGCREESSDLQRWVVYAMLCLVSDNSANQRELVKFPKLPHTLRALSKEIWRGWQYNEALKLSEILGWDLEKQEMLEEDEEDDEGDLNAIF
eukprot:gene3152-3621_t